MGYYRGPLSPLCVCVGGVGVGLVGVSGANGNVKVMKILFIL